MDSLMNIMESFETVSETFKNATPSLDTSKWLSRVQDPYYLLTLAINLLILLILYVSLKALFREYKHYSFTQRMKGKVKVTAKGDNPLLKVRKVKAVHDSLSYTLTQKNKQDKKDTLFLVIIGGILAISSMFFVVKQYLLALVVPIFLLDYTLKILQSMEVTDLEYMHMQLPNGIDSILKAATKYGDLKNIFFEASRAMPYPIRTEFEVMARRMNSRESEEVLMETKDKYDDIWVNSFIFILISMLDDAERNLALNNLKSLRDMLSADNNLKLAGVSEKRLSVNTNYALAGIASALGMGTILFTKIGTKFYFSTPLGIISFVGGFALVFATIQINVRLSSTREE